jgi:hypothetical protein
MVTSPIINKTILNSVKDLFLLPIYILQKYEIFCFRANAIFLKISESLARKFISGDINSGTKIFFKKTKITLAWKQIFVILFFSIVF